MRGKTFAKVFPRAPFQKLLNKKDRIVAALLAGKALRHAGRPEVAITAKRYIDVLDVTEDSVPYGLRVAASCAGIFII